eukprot:3230352-Prorocentrum_lima.AAC.1
MTSSLVGSEMCIRDSSLDMSFPEVALGQRAAPGVVVASREQGGFGPVSYTHLTLPTICSV